MPVRFIISLVLAFFLLGEVPIIGSVFPGADGRTGTVLAKAKKKKKVTRKKKKKKRKKSKRRKRRRRPVRPPNPVLADDPNAPLGDALEEHVEEFLKQTKPVYGAFVAIRPGTGEVLTLAEHTSRPRKVAHPGLSAVFPAASIFKIVTAAALLEEKKATEDTVTCYHGGRSRLTRYHLSKPPKRRRRCRRLDSAFANSTNAIFGRLAVERLGSDIVLKYAERLGFNKNLLVDGLKTRSKARRARTSLDLARMAAGFVNASLSPLHAAVMGAIVANGGTLPTTLLSDNRPSVDADGAIRVLGRTTARKLRDMMVKTTTKGTAAKYFRRISSRSGGRQVAVKTGTLTSRDGSGRFNTWMVGFYPARRPEIAFGSVFSVKNGGPIKAGHLTQYAIKTYERLRKSRKKGR